MLSAGTTGSSLHSRLLLERGQRRCKGNVARSLHLMRVQGLEAVHAGGQTFSRFSSIVALYSSYTRPLTFENILGTGLPWHAGARRRASCGVWSRLPRPRLSTPLVSFTYILGLFYLYTRASDSAACSRPTGMSSC